MSETLRKTKKQGVIIANLGTPSAPTPKAIRQYLFQFLHDKRVVDLTRWIWCWVLHLFILRFRPKALAPRYAEIWTQKGSPLLAITLAQVEKLQARFAHHNQIKIVAAMRYGEPSIARACEALSDCDSITVIPMYPQYSGTTTASTFDALAQYFVKQRNIPSLNFIKDFYDHPLYIAALAASVRQFWAKNGRGTRLLLSFHGIPQRYVDLGDPYQKQCEITAQLLAESLQLKPQEWALTYQSRLGREPWLQPYTDVVLPEWAKQGIAMAEIICPGFPADCLETLEEAAMQYAELFKQSGGGTLRYIPALNDSPELIELLTDLILKNQ